MGAIMRKRYIGTVVGISKLKKPIVKKLSPDDDCNTFEIEGEFFIKDIRELGTEEIIVDIYKFLKTKKWEQVSSIIYNNNEITFEALFENGQFKSISNICGENPYGTDYRTKQKFKLQREPGFIGCLYCKYYDSIKETHKNTCYKRETWDK
jgi:hypothetical protein